MIQRVVVIDDSETDRYLVRRTLRRAGLDADVVEYPSASSACDDLLPQDRLRSTFGETPPPVLVMLDINMPRMSGFDLLERLQTEYVASSAPVRVVMYTSSANERDRQRALNCDLVVDYAVKPLDVDVLMRVATRPEFST